MPITLPTALRDAAQAIDDAPPVLWLWELRLQEQSFPGTNLYANLVANPEPVTVGSTTFWPWPLSCSTIEQSANGDLPSLQLSIDNRTRWLMPYMHEHDGMAGKQVKLWLVNAQALPGSLASTFSMRWRIASSEANAEAILCRLELPNLFTLRFPVDRYRADRCDVVRFGDSRCGYIRNDVAAFTNCPRTPTACEDRGADERARRIPVVHPMRFGGFRGVAVNR